jgi:ferredoxin
MASCVKIAPGAFDLDDEGLAVVTGPADDLAIEAAECCPMGAVAVFDQATGDRLV